ncbi:alpha carbonic anhydrase [Chytridium lagenaria]|nr:alpha carbonic anhydrase [Chytridium lagenaria]
MSLSTPSDVDVDSPRTSSSELSTNTLSGGSHGGYIDFDGVRYHLVQIHFHSPNEHKIPGKEFDMEAHFVHSSSDGHLLVFGMFMASAERHNAEPCTFLDGLDHHIPHSKRTKCQHVDHLPLSDAAHHIRSSPSYYVYQGSLTTPPFKEGVVWITAMPHRNVRPAVPSDRGYDTPLRHGCAC